VVKARVCEDAPHTAGETGSMGWTARILIGPYGLHAFTVVALLFFLVFLWAFNFTSFF
jgi:hypothetical protein